MIAIRRPNLLCLALESVSLVFSLELLFSHMSRTNVPLKTNFTNILLMTHIRSVQKKTYLLSKTAFTLHDLYLYQLTYMGWQGKLKNCDWKKLETLDSVRQPFFHTTVESETFSRKKNWSSLPFPPWETRSQAEGIYILIFPGFFYFINLDKNIFFTVVLYE